MIYQNSQVEIGRHGLGFWTGSRCERGDEFMSDWQQDVEIVRKSTFFNPNWYLNNNPIVRALGLDPAEHYYWFGHRLGRDPSPQFSTRSYQRLHPEVEKQRINPLVHLERNKKLDRELPSNLRFDDTEPSKCTYFEPSAKVNPFDAWKLFNGQSTLRDQNTRLSVAALADHTKFSIIVPVYNPPPEVLERCIESVINQSYQNFELVLVDDRSTDARVVPILSQYQRKDRRVIVKVRSENGHISRATNDAVDLATGEFLVFLDNDDALARDALAIIVSTIAEDTSTDLLYSDDAKFIDSQDALFSPKFKTGWSPELLLSYCYVSHIKVIRTSLYRSVGGCQVGLEGSQDHDLYLRVSELTNRVKHIPHILYHRRVLPGSTAASGHAKPYSFEAGRKACEDAFKRRKIECNVVQPAWAFERGLGVFVPVMPDSGPDVALLIPTKNNWRILDRLLQSLRKTTYKNFKTVILDNASDDPDTQAYLRGCGHEVWLIPNKGANFNFSYINNVAAKRAQSEFVLFLNDDMEVIDDRWLSQMMGWAHLEGVGVVGARLLYADGRVQHGGIVTSLPWHIGRTAFRGLPRSDLGYLLLARVTRNCAAVTGACMLTRRETFLRLGGFDEQNFGIAYNDIDYCIRARATGLRVVYCGEAELLHHEGTSRDKMDSFAEIAEYAARYARLDDPYLNPNLSLDTNRFDIASVVVPPSKRRVKIRVLAVTHNLRPEGAPNSAAELLCALSKDKEFEIVVASPTDGPVKARYAEAGITVDILGPDYSLARNIPQYDDFLKLVARRLQISNFDVVYANTSELFWVIDAAHKAGVPTIWNIRESESWKIFFSKHPENIARRAMECFALPYRVIFVAHSTRKRWESANKMGNFHVINNGIDATRFENGNIRAASRKMLGIGDDKITLLSVGTISVRKGQHDLIWALEALPVHTAARIKVLLVGAQDSEYLAYLKKLVEGLPEPHRMAIEIIEETPNVAHYWSAADIFVCTSRLESYPRVILEAMLHGLPIVTTPTYGIAEQVREGVNALFYEASDFASLSQHLNRLVENESLRASMGAASRRVLSGLTSYADMVRQYKAQFLAAAFSACP